MTGQQDSQRCSRAGCQSPAEFSVNWRNPKIHAADRVKVWLACGEHRDFLAGYLEARSFPVSVVTIESDTVAAAAFPGTPA